MGRTLSLLTIEDGGPFVIPATSSGRTMENARTTGLQETDVACQLATCRCTTKRAQIKNRVVPLIIGALQTAVVCIVAPAPTKPGFKFCT